MNKYLEKIMQALKPLTLVKSDSHSLVIREDEKDGTITVSLSINTCPELRFNTYFSVANGEQLRISSSRLHLNKSCLKSKLLPNILAYYVASNIAFIAETEYSPALKQEYKEGPAAYDSIIEYTNKLFEHATKGLDTQQYNLVRLVTIASEVLRYVNYDYSKAGISVKDTETDFCVEASLDPYFDYPLTIKPKEKGYVFTIGKGDSAVSRELIKYRSLKGKHWDRKTGFYAIETSVKEMVSEYYDTAKEVTIKKRLLKMEKHLEKQSKELKALMSALDIY